MSCLKCLDIAYYFISSKEYGDLTNLKLQKMLYYAQGMHLSYYGSPLFNEKIEAWQYGPVVHKAYNEFKKYKDMPIPHFEYNKQNDIDNKKDFLDEVYIKYGKYSASKLCKLTHEKTSPWHTVYVENKTLGDLINNKLIKIYFDESLKLEKGNNIDPFDAAKLLSKDKSMQETMHVFSNPYDAEKIAEALEEIDQGKIIDFDWRSFK